MIRTCLSVLTKPSLFASRTRTFASAQDQFEQAQALLKTVKEDPDVETKLKLYSLFKQASVGDVSGSRPGMMDFAGRAKYDAWAKNKGMSQDAAKSEYAKVISGLVSSESAVPTSATVEGLAPVNGLDVSIEGKAFKITLNRPEKFNAITVDMYRGLIAALKASSENRATSVTVISANGNYFCSGNDLGNFAKAATASREEIKKMAEDAGEMLQEYIDTYINHEKPIIALINGPAIGIAVTVLPLFEYVLASDKSTFNTPFATLGQSPEGCSSYTFPLLMGQMRAAEVLLFGKTLTASKAQEYGLITEVVPHNEFKAASKKVVEKLSSLPPESLRINKMLLRRMHKEALLKCNEDECRTIEERWQSKECAQAIASFLARSAK
ncbi:unnamed protein product [Auanema sp. JU1783]|nr:unnamed protein product [Auanema sp. JU1783]